MKRSFKIVLSRDDLYAERYDKMKYYQISEEGGDEEFRSLSQQAITRLIMKIVEEETCDDP